MKNKETAKGSEELIKKYDAWIKGGFGTMGMLTVMNTVFIIRALIKKDLGLWLEFSFTEFIFSKCPYFSGSSGNLPLWAALILTLAYSGLLLVLALRSVKKPVLLVPCLVIYLADSALLAFTMITDYYGNFSEASWINPIVHVIMLVLLISGIYAAAKKKKAQ